MRKTFIPSFLAAVLALSPLGLRADEQPPSTEVTAPAIETTTDETRPPREVGAASTDAAEAAKKRKWQNIAIAGAAVIVAATAIYLASTNGGHND
ncbi:MAG: hypothetical protein V4494_05360 [Chlamydiota bacterium]